MSGAQRDILNRFMTGQSVRQVHQGHPTAPYSDLADAYFAARSEREREYSPRLCRQLNDVAMACGLSRVVVARRALEALACRQLIGAAVHGRISGRPQRKIAAQAIPNFMRREKP